MLLWSFFLENFGYERGMLEKKVIFFILEVNDLMFEIFNISFLNCFEIIKYLKRKREM